MLMIHAQHPAANVKLSKIFRLVLIFSPHTIGIGYANMVKSISTFKMPITNVTFP